MKLNKQSKIAPEVTDILLNRIFISRELKIFTLTEIATNWSITPRTLFRYSSVKDREYSRLVARRTTEAYRNKDKTVCQICGKKLFGHERCKLCTMLIHDVPECSCEKSCIVILNPTKMLLQITSKNYEQKPSISPCR